MSENVLDLGDFVVIQRRLSRDLKCDAFSGKELLDLCEFSASIRPLDKVVDRTVIARCLNPEITFVDLRGELDFQESPMLMPKFLAELVQKGTIGS